MGSPVRVLIEQGRTWTFASALDWPGWARRARGGDEAALEALDAYSARYAPVAGPRFEPGAPEVVARVPGTATTDFGAPDAVWDGDLAPLGADESARLIGLLRRSWSYLDEVVAASPAELRKGPRGGGRDRDAMVAHVVEAERSYGRRIGAAVAPRTPWPEQREAIAAAAAAGDRGGERRWPVRYLVRRAAWHVVDHAWEIQDRSPAR